MKIWCVLTGIAPVSLDNLPVKAAGVPVAWGEGLRELSSRPICGTQGQGAQRSPLLLQVEHTWTLKAMSKTKTGCAPQSYRDSSSSEIQQRGLNSTNSSRGCVRAAHATLHISDRDIHVGCSVSRPVWVMPIISHKQAWDWSFTHSLNQFSQAPIHRKEMHTENNEHVLGHC